MFFGGWVKRARLAPGVAANKGGRDAVRHIHVFAQLYARGGWKPRAARIFAGEVRRAAVAARRGVGVGAPRQPPGLGRPGACLTERGAEGELKPTPPFLSLSLTVGLERRHDVERLPGVGFAGLDRAAIDHEGRAVQTGGRDDRARHVLVAPRQRHVGVVPAERRGVEGSVSSPARGCVRRASPRSPPLAPPLSPLLFSHHCAPMTVSIESAIRSRDCSE